MGAAVRQTDDSIRMCQHRCQRVLIAVSKIVNLEAGLEVLSK